MKILNAYIVFLTILSACIFGQPGRRTFSWKDGSFLLDGKPFIIRSGEIHYPRVPKIYWRDRLRKAKAMGLNTITTYVFWNLHEPRKGQFDFSGNLDVVEFIMTAREEGLYVIVRPGPYICTEWDFGGIPAWLLAEPDMKVRTSDARFLAASRRYISEVGRRLAPLQITRRRGGNIIMTQIENEYGVFGEDKAYLNAIKKMFVDAGFDVPLFTSDVANEKSLNAGTLPDVLPVINFGVMTARDIPTLAGEFEILAKFRPNSPKMAGEYWIGQFDHWGEKRRPVSAEKAAEGVNWMLENGVSFNLYMFHGGTSFGFMNGANISRQGFYEPDVSSYDYDAPLDEAGNPTPKYFLLRDVIRKFLPKNETLPVVPQNTELMEIPEFELRETAQLFSLLKNPVTSERTVSMEEIGQSYGFILYRKRLGSDPQKLLKFESVRDYAHVFVDGALIGTLDRRSKQTQIEINGKSGSVLDILVENHGRVNAGKEFIFERKGLIGWVRLGDEGLRNWQMYNLPLDNLSTLRFKNGEVNGSGPAFYRGGFRLRKVRDTFFDMTTWGKGHVWINGHHLGRFWKIGPQQTLFVPASWLKKGENEVIVLEVNGAGRSLIRGLKSPLFHNQ